MASHAPLIGSACDALAWSFHDLPETTFGLTWLWPDSAAWFSFPGVQHFQSVVFSLFVFTQASAYIYTQALIGSLFKFSFSNAIFPFSIYFSYLSYFTP